SRARHSTTGPLPPGGRYGHLGQFLLPRRRSGGAQPCARDPRDLRELCGGRQRALQARGPNTVRSRCRAPTTASRSTPFSRATRFLQSRRSSTAIRIVSGTSSTPVATYSTIRTRSSPARSCASLSERSPATREVAAGLFERDGGSHFGASG